MGQSSQPCIRSTPVQQCRVLARHQQQLPPPAPGLPQQLEGWRVQCIATQCTSCTAQSPSCALHNHVPASIPLLLTCVQAASLSRRCRAALAVQARTTAATSPSWLSTNTCVAVGSRFACWYCCCQTTNSTNWSVYVALVFTSKFGGERGVWLLSWWWISTAAHSHAQQAVVAGHDDARCRCLRPCCLGGRWLVAETHHPKAVCT